MRRSNTSATCSNSLERLIAIILVYLSYHYSAESLFDCQHQIHDAKFLRLRMIIKGALLPLPHLWGEGWGPRRKAWEGEGPRAMIDSCETQTSSAASRRYLRVLLQKMNLFSLSPIYRGEGWGPR